MQKDRPTLAASSFAIVSDLRPASPIIVLMTPVCASELVSGEDYSSYHQRVAVLFDADEDERVIDVLTAILYRAPEVYKKIAAVGEHKGTMTIWTQTATDADRAVLFRAADPVATRGDRWPVEVREMFPDTEGQGWKVRKYTHASRGGIPSVAGPDNRDTLVRALFEVVPLGIDWAHWTVPLYSDPAALPAVGAFGPPGSSTLAQQFGPESDSHLMRDVEEVLAQTPKLDNSRKPTLTLRRSRGSRE
jgi:hypothetical protein